MKTKSATSEERALHNSILGSDDLALSKLYHLHGESVIKCLKNRYPKISKSDVSLIIDAVNQAFFGYYTNPSTFDPDKNSLHRFLEIASERDLLNILEKEKRHKNKKELPENVEVQENFWNRVIGGTETTDGQMIRQEVMDRIDKELTCHFDSEKDILMAKLILAEERRTEIFAEILQIENCGTQVQRKEVKKHKDRIKKVIERQTLEDKIKKLIRDE